MPAKPPSPDVTLCMGLKSSGSTWLYNVVIRILKETEPKSAVAAFYADNFRMIPKGVEKARHLVVKTHEPSEALLFLTRFARGKMFVTVREPRDAAASLIQRFGHSFDSALKDIRTEAEHILALMRTHETMLLRYEDGFYRKEETVGRIAAHLGLKLSAAARKRIHHALDAGRVKKKIASLQDKGTFGTNPDEFDPKTHWHPGHVGDGRVGKYASVLTKPQQKKIADATASYRRKFGYLPRKR